MLGMTGKLVFTVLCSILLLLVLGISENAYASEYVAPPGVSISEIRSGEFTPEDLEEWIKQTAEVGEPAVQFKKYGNTGVEYRPLYTTVDDPSNHIVGPGGTLAGVGELLTFRPGEGTFRCSGALLPTGLHILTAAHCVTNNSGVVNPGTNGDVLFETATGDVIIDFANFIVHPAWDGDVIRGNDLAYIELVSLAPANIPTYDIDRDGSDDLGVAFDKAGYGRSGFGATGDNIDSGVKRQGENLYDSVADIFLEDSRFFNPPLTPNVDFVPGSVLLYDFDNAVAANDAFGVFYGISELGLGTDEVMSAPGDSGGPTLDGQVITAITSYGFRLSSGGSSSDVNSMVDSSFGEFGGDTRVSFYSGFIDGLLDFDGDGVLNNVDICPGGDDALDADFDGVPDACDICPAADDNADADVDGIPDACDGIPLDFNRLCQDTSGSWNADGSWFTNEIPTSSQRVVMNNCDLTVQGGENVVVNNILDDDSTNQLTVDGDMIVAASGQVNIAGIVDINSNSLEVHGTFTVQSGGVHNNNVGAVTKTRNGGNFNVDSGGIVNNAGKFITQSTGTTTVTGEWNEKTGTPNENFGTFNVASGGVYDNESGGTTKSRGGNFNVQSGGILNNDGTFVTELGGTTSVSGEWNEKTGTPNVIHGILNVASGGVYDNEVNALTKIRNGGNFNVQSGGILNNDGTFVTQSGGTTSVSGEWNEKTGTTNVIHGTFNVASGGVYDNEVNALTKIRNAANFNVQSGGILNNDGTFVTQVGGTTTIAGEWNEKTGTPNVIHGTFNVASGGVYDNEASAITKIRNAANFNVLSGGTVNNIGVFETQTGGTTSVAGEWNQSGTRNDIYGILNVASGGVYDNEANALTKIKNGGNFNVNSGGTVNNDGKFNTQFGGTTSVSGEWNEKSGTTNDISGILNVDSGGVYDNETNGITKIRNGGTFNLQIGGTVNNLGKINKDCTGMFNDFGGTYTGNAIRNVCV